MRGLPGRAARPAHRGVRLRTPARSAIPQGTQRCSGPGTATRAWASSSRPTPTAGSGCCAARRPSSGWTTGRSPTGAPHPEAAHAFINFVLTPENALRRARLHRLQHRRRRTSQAAAESEGLTMLDIVFFTPEQLETMHERRGQRGAGAPRGDLERGEGRRGCVDPPAGAFALALPAWAWLLLFFVAPVAMVVWFSFGYKPGIFGTHANDILSLDRYAEALSPTFFATFQNTLWVGIAGTALCFAHRRAGRVLDGGEGAPERRGILIALVLVPFWTNFLVRTIGWQVILAPRGLALDAAAGRRRLEGPLEILYTRTAVLHRRRLQLPAADDPAAVRGVRPRRPAAARGVEGPRRRASWTTFFRVTLPLAGPGSSPACCWCSSR